MVVNRRKVKGEAFSAPHSWDLGGTAMIGAFSADEPGAGR